SNPSLPLSFYADATFFKVYMSDVGLLRRKSGLSHQTILGESELYNNFKGALTENYVLNELVALGKHPYFWRSGNIAELDFLLEDRDRVIPVEAKAEIRTKAKSYQQFCKRFSPSMGFRFSMKNVGENLTEKTRTYSLPLYLLWKLDRYLSVTDTDEK
ncbi:MAG: DUF4143 domain-containing protein, partial [Lachnospiraceae bacterium]|nr:DUF4143 domain-containing protein [Lachnospiraceae bacterium]